jgi:hypothetical protein
MSRLVVKTSYNTPITHISGDYFFAKEIDNKIIILNAKTNDVIDHNVMQKYTGNKEIEFLPLNEYTQFLPLNDYAQFNKIIKKESVGCFILGKYFYLLCNITDDPRLHVIEKTYTDMIREYIDNKLNYQMYEHECHIYKLELIKFKLVGSELEYVDKFLFNMNENNYINSVLDKISNWKFIINEKYNIIVLCRIDCPFDEKFDSEIKIIRLDDMTIYYYDNYFIYENSDFLDENAGWLYARQCRSNNKIIIHLCNFQLCNYESVITKGNYTLICGDGTNYLFDSSNDYKEPKFDFELSSKTIRIRAFFNRKRYIAIISFAHSRIWKSYSNNIRYASESVPSIEYLYELVTNKKNNKYRMTINDQIIYSVYKINEVGHYNLIIECNLTFVDNDIMFDEVCIV